MFFVERSIIYCPYLRGSTIKGSMHCMEKNIEHTQSSYITQNHMHGSVLIYSSSLMQAYQFICYRSDDIHYNCELVSLVDTEVCMFGNA